MKNKFGALSFILLLIICLGCRFFAPPKTTDSDKNKPLTWMDMPVNQPYPVAVPPYDKPLKKLLPSSSGDIILRESEATVQGFEKPLETWAAVYGLPGNPRMQFHLYIQNFSNSDLAYHALINRITGNLGGEISTVEPTYKNEKTVGTKICMIKPGSNRHCTDITWTDGSVMTSMWSEDFDTEVEGFYQNLPF